MSRRMNPNSIKNLRPATKGEVRNPLGAGAHNKEMKALKALTVKEVAAVGELILQNNMDAIREIAESEDASVLKVWVAKIALIAMKKGDAAALNILLDRFIGRVPNQVVLQGLNTQPRAQTDLSKLSKSELRDLEKILMKAEAKEVEVINISAHPVPELPEE